MGFKCGIVGLPNVGKSTLFNAMTSGKAAAENFPFCTIDPNVGIVALNDPRLTRLAEIFHPDKITPTTVEFVDIAGLVQGASQGEGLGNQFLGHIRSVDAIVHIVRCFEDPDVVHVHGAVDPIRDIEVIKTELALADVDTLTKRIAKLEKQAKGGDKKSVVDLEVSRKALESLNAGTWAREMALTEEERASLRDAYLLTMKPVLYVCNVSETGAAPSAETVIQVKNLAAREKAEVVVVSGKIESEIALLDPLEKADFLKDLGVEESGLDRLAHTGYKLLGLVTFFTAGKPEVRAWTVAAGSHAPQAAGVIHSDFEKGFIRAECYRFEDIDALGNEHKVKEAGKLRVEGKDYVVQDGDVLFFRFNV